MFTYSIVQAFIHFIYSFGYADAATTAVTDTQADCNLHPIPVVELIIKKARVRENESVWYRIEHTYY